ncbi:MAG: zinc ribbon domain-containing protein [Parolsenella sp.]|uniref:zinc ribbon domain-containing protein n=1 Tax=Parolsenella sp. TaxID=2083006 RepID=UPI002E777B14|nr:zinc ribbon domain-containing protein [Parolsenella sp.]MEE1372178.1 zinc ribbon domain-containing protein [Parolsenella sp.]
MSLVICPECGSKISDRARTCPVCGYTGPDETLAISAQTCGEIERTEYKIEPWRASPESVTLARKDQEAIVGYLIDEGGLAKAAPAIIENLRQLGATDTQYVAKLTPQLRKMLAEGKLKFQYDKNGELMAILRDGEKQVIRKQLRLEEIVSDKAAAESINNLTTVSMLNQVLEEVREVREAIGDLHVELQNDRLALAESAQDKLAQAQAIQDARLREAAILNAISGATDAKHRLMRNFSLARADIIKSSGKGGLELLVEWHPGADKKLDAKAADAFDDLMQLMGATQVECAGWSMLGEYESARTALEALRSFILANELNNPDTLLLINETGEKSQEEIVEGFKDVAKRIEGLTAREGIEGVKYQALPARAEEQQDED